MQRSSVSGVSIDEEMVNLIAQQEAYAAAARLIQMADEVIQDLLQMV
jgi:flagellar hook-associated protein 1